MLRAAVYTPCTCCNSHELDVLRKEQGQEKAKWLYTVKALARCDRCDTALWKKRVFWVCYSVFGAVGVRMFARLYRRMGLSFVLGWLLSALWIRHRFDRTREVTVRVPFLMDDVSVWERLMGAATVSERGSKLRPFGSFISMLTTYDASSVVKTALLVWAPLAVGGYIDGRPGFKREPLPGQATETADPVEVRDAEEGNADLQGSGQMPGTSVDRDAYKHDVVNKSHEQCMNNAVVEPCEPRVLAHQVGPNLRNAECFETTSDNIAAALDNRNQAPGFHPSRSLKRKITKTVDALIAHVFTRQRIQEWRREWVDKDGNLVCQSFEDMKSKKWTQNRFDEAVESSLADIHHRIEQEFMNKVNEVQDAGDKLPRPRNLIQAGDESQVKMLLPIKCFEDLLFKHFKDASIKKGTKHEAMQRVSQHLNQRKPVTTVEGDGSSWDACCNAAIRDLTENRILAHVIDCLGYDAEVPSAWMAQCLADMKSVKIRGKAKIIDFVMNKTRVKIDSIRQSGHRGTSCFNWLINFVCWASVLAENPEDMIKKVYVKKKGGYCLPERYVSSYDGQEYTLRYVYEGDDSALTTSEEVRKDARKEDIIKQWTSLGFKMKLVFCDQVMTFTGFNFLVSEHGPRPTFFPEIKRNVASSSWTTSPEVRANPGMIHRVASAMFLARAENFRDCEPLCHFFAALGLAHINKHVGDGTIGEDEAMQLGITPGVIFDRLHEAISGTHSLTKEERRLIVATVGEVEEEKLAGLVNVSLDDPYDTARAKHVLPVAFWKPKDGAPPPRPRGQTARLLAMCK